MDDGAPRMSPAVMGLTHPRFNIPLYLYLYARVERRPIMFSLDRHRRSIRPSTATKTTTTGYPQRYAPAAITADDDDDDCARSSTTAAATGNNEMTRDFSIVLYYRHGYGFSREQSTRAPLTFPILELSHYGDYIRII